jgi:ribosome-associated translation inhibitor RaiA
LEIVKALNGDEIILKLERQLDKSKTLMEDKQGMAIRGEALFDETQTNC